MTTICHVCKKEKKPYTVILDNSVFSFLKYQTAREDGEICERCDRYYALTGEFKDATEAEFTIAEKAVWFAHMMLGWWTKDGKLTDEGNQKRDWGGTEPIATWCRNYLAARGEKWLKL